MFPPGVICRSGPAFAIGCGNTVTALVPVALQPNWFVTVSE